MLQGRCPSLGAEARHVKGKDGKTELGALLKEHADGHGDATLLEPLIMKCGTKPFIVDPMHCLELNLAKSLWKYSFGDRMTDDDREEVAAYLTSIGLHLDIRAKGKRDPQQKWFSAAQFDEFVLGTFYYKKSKSPGLSANIMAIVHIIFGSTTVASAVDAAATTSDPPPAKKPSPELPATLLLLWVAIALARLAQLTPVQLPHLRRCETLTSPPTVTKSPGGCVCGTAIKPRQ